MLGATAKLVPSALVVLMGLALTSGASWKDFISSKGLSSPILNIPIVGGVRSLDQAELTSAENMNMVKAALDASGINNYSDIQIVSASRQVVAGFRYGFQVNLKIKGKPLSCSVSALLPIPPKIPAYSAKC